jgi:hypothetical protein
VFLKELKEAEDGDAREGEREREREKERPTHDTNTTDIYCSAISWLSLAQPLGVLKQKRSTTLACPVCSLGHSFIRVSWLARGCWYLTFAGVLEHEQE